MNSTKKFVYFVLALIAFVVAGNVIKFIVLLGGGMVLEAVGVRFAGNANATLYLQLVAYIVAFFSGLWVAKKVHAWLSGAMGVTGDNPPATSRSLLQRLLQGPGA